MKEYASVMGQSKTKIDSVKVSLTHLHYFLFCVGSAIFIFISVIGCE